MRSQLLTLLTGLTAVVTAHPGSALFERQACNADLCLRAVRASTAGPASTDCSSFLARTVTSCGGTVTTTSLVTTTISTATVNTFVDTTSTVTSSSTTTVAGPTTTVVSTTSTSFGTSTSVVTSTITSTIAVSTVTSTTTLSAVPTGPGGPGSPGQPGKKAKRQQCVPTTRTNTAIPAYATAGCQTSTSRYSSACRCIGVVTGTTTTVGAAAVTSTETSTTGVTTTTTVTSTRSTLQTVRPTATVSTTVTVTSTTTLVNGASTTVLSTTTVTTTTATGSTTVFATVQPTSGTFQLVLPGGRKLGISPSDNSLIPVEGGVNGATFSLNALSYLQSSTLTFGVNAVTGGPDTVFGFATTPANPLRCTLSNPPSRGALICRVSDSERFFSLCNNKVVLANSFQQQPCAAIDLQAV